jgi:hypothetical protein
MTTSFAKECSEVSFLFVNKGAINDDGLLEFQRMADALAQVEQYTGTKFVYSLCEWGWVSLESLFLGLGWLLTAI